jgi:23S rRNA pseudouridine1911/1915/1917 synthase
MNFLHERWPVFYEDNHLLVLYKPSGLLAQANETGGVCLLELARAWIKKRYRKPGRVFLGLVHRLDRPVAGVMMFARTSKAAARLSDQVRSRKIRKTYMAVVQGEPRHSDGRLVHHLERHSHASCLVGQPTPLSREARLIYRVLDAADDRSLLEIELETGRRHQIRLQLAHIGCPVVGDVRYGATHRLPSRQIALFARQIALEHPTRREPLEFTSPLPAGWPWPTDEIADTAPLWNWEDYAIPAGSF